MNRNPHHPKQQSRRQFVRTAAAAGLGLPLLAGRLRASEPDAGLLFTRYGLNAGLDRAQEVQRAGFDFLLLPVNQFLKPDLPEAEFEKELRRLEKSPLPVLSCNSFLRGNALRSVGPQAKTANVLRFAETAFARARRAGVKHIIFGSSGSRRRPEDWTKEQVDQQFIALLKRMGPMAGEQGIIVALENLQQRECNYLTRIAEVGEIVAQVDHPNIRVLVDLYHASRMQDPPEDVGKYARLTAVVEIAEAEGRTPPGVNGQDFRPYFNALKAGGFSGPIEIEGRWDLSQLPTALATIRRQSA